MRELKITDLSIGDWVMLEHEEENPDGSVTVQREGPVKAYRLATNGAQCLFCYGSGVIRNNYGFGILPIPITPAILENNGFVGEIDGDDPVRTEYVFKAVNIAGFADCDFYHCRIRHPEGWGRILFPKIHYVHELQHALRFAGIEKEIEL